jgi:ribosomal protein S18 acetylase RimI-like enzyme
MYMGYVVEACSDPHLVMVIERQWFDYMGYLPQHAPRGEVFRDASLTRGSTGVPHPSWNGVSFTHLTPENRDHKIEETVNYFTSRNLPFTWWTGPSTRPPNLGEHLEAHGFIHTSDMPGMAIELSMIQDDLPQPSGLRIEPVEDIVTLKKYAQVATTCFDMPAFIDNFFDIEANIGLKRFPPRRNYIGYLKGEPIASSSLLLAQGVAGIYVVGTLPEARRKGIGTAMTLAPLQEARNRGYNVGVTHSSPMGLGVYQRMGFKEYCKIGSYKWLGETAQAN